VILFLVIYPLYVLFSRQPDFFDGELYRATIHHVHNAKQKEHTVAIYSIEHHTYSIPADYPFSSFTEGEKVKIIYEAAAPENGSLYSLWGYWIKWKELLSFLVMFSFFYLLAVNITSHPTPESLLEELEGNQPKPRKPRYDN
jgi:hypothetical protein